MIAFFTSCSMCVQQTGERRVLCVLHRCEFFSFLLLLRHHNFASTTMSATSQRRARAHTQHLCRLTNIIIYCRASCDDGEKNWNNHGPRLPLPANACVFVCVRCRTRHLNGGGAAAVHRWLKLTSWKDQRCIFKEIFECVIALAPAMRCADSAISHTNNRNRSSNGIVHTM